MKKKLTSIGMSVILGSLLGCSATNNPSSANMPSQLPIETQAGTAAQAVTLALNNTFLNEHDLVDNEIDFNNAKRGLIVKPTNVTIACEGNCGERPAWTLADYQEMLNNNIGSVPSTVNPSLWRNFKLLMEYGLYRVTDRTITDTADAGYADERHIYQVRGYDLSNITFVRTPGETAAGSDDGWLVLDPLISKETAAAALALINDTLLTNGEIPSALPVRGVLYSHSHIDHFGGVRGLLDASGSDVSIIAPAGFLEHAVSENVIAGNAMSRRAIYMYGSLTGVGETKGVGAGLGLTTSIGEPTLIAPQAPYIVESTTPTGCVPRPADPLTAQCDAIKDLIYFDGLAMEFQMTPGTEAPAEMNTYFSYWGGLWMAENATNTMHNVLTLRGAEVRDPLLWSKFMTETINRWGDTTTVKFQSHHWPVWNTNEVTGATENNVIPYLEKQGDIYKFIHDQSVRLMNQGYTGEEISELIKLPKSLDSNWATRGYYGTLKHNSRAVYQKYMGWYSGNPSDLNNLPPVKVAKKYVEYMGGDIAAIITRVEDDIATANAADLSTYKKAQAANETYRWAAEVLKHVVFATHIPDDPTCTSSCSPAPTEAELLLADVYEQLGYQAESGPWRAVYLQAALELRDPEKVGGPALATASDDISTNMTLSMLFDYLAIQLDPQKLKSNVEAQLSGTPFEEVVLNVRVNVTGDVDAVEGTIGTYLVTVRNSVFNYTEIDALDSLDSTPLGNVSIQLTRDVLDNILIGAINADICTPTNSDDCISVTSGNPEVLNVIQSSLTSPEFWFRIVTPRPDTPTQ